MAVTVGFSANDTAAAGAGGFCAGAAGLATTAGKSRSANGSRDGAVAWGATGTGKSRAGSGGATGAGATGAAGLMGGATPIIVPRMGGFFLGIGGAAGGWVPTGSPKPRAAPRAGAGDVSRGSEAGGSTWKLEPHLGQRILSPLAGTRRSSTW
jgi:hypothetical protein